jgi:hypothetical protein
VSSVPSAPAVVPIALAPADLLAVVPAPAVHEADRHPALVYLASLGPGTRRTMRQSLDVVAATLTGGRADHLTLPWHRLRYQHTAAVRAALAERYKPGTANKVLAAVRGTLEGGVAPRPPRRRDLPPGGRHRRGPRHLAPRGPRAPGG